MINMNKKAYTVDIERRNTNMSKFSSIEEYELALYNVYCKYNSYKQTTVDNTDINNHNISITMTNKLNFITSIYNEVKDKTIFTHRLESEYIVFLSNIIVSRHSDKYLLSDFKNFNFSVKSDKVPYNVITFLFGNDNIVPIKNYKYEPIKARIWDMCRKLSIAICHRDYYTQYLYNIHSKIVYSAPAKQCKKFEMTRWQIHDVTYQEYVYLLNSLLEYDRLQDEMFKAYEDLVQTKADKSALECVVRYKEVERQLTEYTNELDDANKRLEHYQKIDNNEYNMSLFKPHKKEHHIKRIANKSNYQERLQCTLKELIRYCTETLEVRKHKMECNHDYIALNETLVSQKDSYTLAQKKVRNYRRKFLKYKVSPKSAMWKYDNHFGAVQWFKVSDIRYLKMYDKVTFDYKTMELKLH